ncbi:hypothetical protein KKH23_01965 [Patescibacteria group bacterium]|nr:hypothetical protein [Patescibacteria group bacterium]MBU0777000.1 hypothetical protein [Patescibacteria group bacterium]MBU0845947.1 hypothetical protein [Patescibacteria group bacterium]MBU0923030.1 hypothetical protein [Patescibacteria group bacterium]MBU1066205.1 hypothetical protein [Patescibacteria group bacterium]
MSSVERVGDMEGNRLIIWRQEDGDIVVIVNDIKRETYASVEFCTSPQGGGKSPYTFNALLKVIEAMEKENTMDEEMKRKRGKN